MWWVQDRGRQEQNNSKRAILHQSQNGPKVGGKKKAGKSPKAGGGAQASRKRQEEGSGGQGQRIDFTGEQAVDPAPPALKMNEGREGLDWRLQRRKLRLSKV